MLGAASHYKTQFPAGHEEGPQAGGDKSSVRYHINTGRRPLQGGGKGSGRYRKRAAARQAAVTQMEQLVKKRPLQEAGGS